MQPSDEHVTTGAVSSFTSRPHKHPLGKRKLRCNSTFLDNAVGDGSDDSAMPVQSFFFLMVIFKVSFFFFRICVIMLVQKYHPKSNHAVPEIFH
jgi:hypothetical protein